LNIISKEKIIAKEKSKTIMRFVFALILSLKYKQKTFPIKKMINSSAINGIQTKNCLAANQKQNQLN
jgi:hypothetical protein